MTDAKEEERKEFIQTNAIKSKATERVKEIWFKIYSLKMKQ